jgi:lysozyme
MTMTTSLKDRIIIGGLTAVCALLPVFEGTKLKAYRDPIGIWTDCVGHTGPDVRPGGLNSTAQCDEKLYKDVLTANAVVNSCVTVPLNDNQRSAFVSFAFNVGRGGRGIKDGFCVLKNGNQPSFLVKLNNKDYTSACNGLTKWVNAAGQPLPGLVKRREAEATLCKKGI